MKLAPAKVQLDVDRKWFSSDPAYWTRLKAILYGVVARIRRRRADLTKLVSDGCGYADVLVAER